MIFFYVHRFGEKAINRPNNITAMTPNERQRDSMRVVKTKVLSSFYSRAGKTNGRITRVKSGCCCWWTPATQLLNTYNLRLLFFIVFRLRESSRTLRVRLGSINYKKGGTILPVKYFEVHPNFDDKSPIFDIALIRLPHPVRFIPTLKPIRLQNNHKQHDNTHFSVTSWPIPYVSKSSQRFAVYVVF